MKTLADLKRDVQNKNLVFELVERYGSTGDDIPEKLRGKRKAIKTNTVGITLLNSHGEESELSFSTAKLMDYDGESLTVYEKGKRDLTAEEQSVLDTWTKIEMEYEKENPFGDSFWKRKEYFKNCSCPWMLGFNTVKGNRYLAWEHKVLDNQIRGEVILKYKITEEN